MSGEQNWRIPNGKTQAETYLGNQQRRNDIADRRPVIRKASDLGLGPGISAAAVPITDFNNLLATYNGYYSAAQGAVNSPNPLDKLVGTVVMDSATGGVQRFTGLLTGIDYKRAFIRNPSDPESISWGAWQTGPGDVPIASLMPYAGPVAPYGYLICDGSAYSTALYPKLFTVLGTSFGGSGGSFNLPDLRDRTPYGVGTNWSFAETDGLALASRTVDLWHHHNVATAESGTHSHSAFASSAGSHDHGGVTGAPSGTVDRGAGAVAAAGPTHTHDISSAGAHEHTVPVADGGLHSHTGVTFDFGEIEGTRLRGVGLQWIIRHGEL